MLAMVVMIMTFVAGALLVLATHTAARHRQRNTDRVHLAARLICESARAYAVAHADEWRTRPPAGPLKLDLSALVSPRLEAEAVLTVAPRDRPAICRIVVRATRFRTRIERTLELPLDADDPTKRQ
jgi:hypothetical protein